MNLQRIIGITGGIATGKSTVAQYLADKYHLPIFDADIYAKEAIDANSPILRQIFKRYGESIRQENGDLNRQALGNIIFNDSLEKQWLEEQIHPVVRNCFEAVRQTNSSPVLVFVIPLLFEAKMTDLVKEIWVVTCPLSAQIQRLQHRNHLTEEQAIARIKSQWPLKRKISRANVIINNHSTPEALWQQIDQNLRLWKTQTD